MIILSDVQIFFHRPQWPWTIVRHLSFKIRSTVTSGKQCTFGRNRHCCQLLWPWAWWETCYPWSYLLENRWKALPARIWLPWLYPTCFICYLCSPYHLRTIHGSSKPITTFIGSGILTGFGLPTLLVSICFSYKYYKYIILWNNWKSRHLHTIIVYISRCSLNNFLVV